jgi:pimeloyl-ACP methyl ester carboxylesterase
VAAAAAVGVGGAAGMAYVLHRRVARSWRAGGSAMVAAGRSLPADLRHHFVDTTDGGRLHVVERGEGPALVLVHGFCLGVASWCLQLRSLAESHRVIALDQRGHGQSAAGRAGYSMERLAADLHEVLVALDVHRAVLVGHSMGGMVAQTLVLDDLADVRARVARLVLVGTTAGPLVPGAPGARVATVLAAGAGRGLRHNDRRGRRLIPQGDLEAWAVRAGFGVRPNPVDLELARSMISATSPAAAAALLGPLLHFDRHQDLGDVRVPTEVVVGSRDALTPPFRARALARGISGARLHVAEGCGHMVMLERAGLLDELLRRLAAEVPVAVP